MEWGREVLWNEALGPSSLDIFSSAPAAWTALKVPLVEGAGGFEFPRALLMEEVVESKSGDVILCKPGANWVGVDDG